MANNTCLSVEEREIFKKCLELKCKSEIEQFEIFNKRKVLENI
jgi:hypothetical protein